MSMGFFRELSEHIVLRINSMQQNDHQATWTESKVHHDYDLWFIQYGHVQVKVGDTRHIARPGDVIFFYPHTLYASSAYNGSCGFTFIHFDFGIGEHLRILNNFNLSGVVPGKLLEAEVRQFLQAFKEYERNMNMSGMRLKGSLLILLAAIMEQHEKGKYAGAFAAESTQSYMKNVIMLQPVFRFIHEQVHRPIPIGELAAIAGMSEKYFITYFKSRLGITPGQYMYQLRMNRAREYLYEKRFTVQQIASMLGYPDQYTFSKSFRKYYNVPPSRFI